MQLVPLQHGQRKHGAVAWTPVGAGGGIEEVYNDGDTLVAVRHMHKQWPSTCNAFSDVREDALRAAREMAGRPLFCFIPTAPTSSLPTYLQEESHSHFCAFG
jgi:hypothetical protein